MTETALWLDGNAIAGLLWEVFGHEMTAAPRGCSSCGQTHPVGAHRAYRGPGVVLRCPHCGDLALRIATLPERHVVQLYGRWTFDVARS
jgi:predicted RNA-binding Zn-ribbon protein involved in translation (DUF1610 family)